MYACVYVHTNTCVCVIMSVIVSVLAGELVA